MDRATAHRDTGLERKATLYVVATPIGNLADVSARALEVLKNVDTIAAEDTRVTMRLLDHYGIRGKLLALHEHNERRMLPRLLGMLTGGKSVALVCDAGTPAISDPGARVVEAAREAGIAVSPVPGPSAAIAALSASGLQAPHFLFYGFLPARAGERAGELEKLTAFAFPMVFYEAPHRVVGSVAAMCAAFGGERRLVIARELTKRFESLHECALGEAEAWLAADPNRVRGEFVLIVAGAAEPTQADFAQGRHALEVLLAELPLKQAVALAARLTGARKNELYELALSLKEHG